MLDHILVPLDGSSLAECVLPYAITMSQIFDARLTLLHVVETGHDDERQIDPLDWHLRKAERQSYLEGVRRRLEEALAPTEDQNSTRMDADHADERRSLIQDKSASIRPIREDSRTIAAIGGRVEAVLDEGLAAERIIEEAQRRGCDLIILSTHGLSGPSGWNVSSVVQKVIFRAPTSILLVRAYAELDGSAAPVKFRHVLAPLDGSRRAECVLPILERIVQEQRAEADLVHIVARPDMPRQVPLSAEDRELVETIVERNQQAATSYMNELTARLPADARGRAVETRVIVSEHTIATLHDLAEKESYDLLVLSAHGYSSAGQRSYGSNVTSFIAYGRSPLLIIQDMPAEELERSGIETFHHATLRQPQGPAPVKDDQTN